MNNINKMVGVALTSLAITGIGLTVQQQDVHAAGYTWVKTKNYNKKPYHAKSVNKNAYVWNANLTKKQHNLKNYPRTTWYVSKSIKMVKGNRSGIFYKVTSDSGKASGYVWRGYVTKGYIDKSTSINATAAGRAETKKIILNILGAKSVNPSMQKIANYVDSLITTDTYEEFKSQLPDNEKDKLVMAASGYLGENIDDLNSGKVTYTQYLKKNIGVTLSEYGLTIDDVQGYKVGMIVRHGAIIYLLPKN